MRLALDIVFQVLVAATFSFGGAVVIALVGGAVLRVRDGRVRLFVLLLPFAKLVIELARGIPESAFFWHKVAGAQQELGGFRLGFGITHFTPRIDFALSAKWHGQFHPQSAADLAATALTRKIGAGTPAIVAAVLVGVALIELVRLVISFTRASRDRAWQRDSVLLEERAIDVRRVTIVTSASWRGAPFATGLWRPIVCLPAHVFDLLSAEEREAVVQHELAHLTGLHALVVFAITLLQRCLWFLPGARLLVREVRAQLEICADDAAVRAGVAPAALAETLVKVAELVRPGARPAPALAFFDRRKVLTRRVRRLLDARNMTSRRLVFAARAIGVALLVGAVLRATTFGNP